MSHRLYHANEMVKIASPKCEGCGICCRGMGDTIHLDPFDIYQITKTTGKSFQEMMEHEIELRVDRALILPNLKMNERTESCCFLDQEGKCRIHEARPGFCRLYPLGREYTDDGLSYFILEDNGCRMTGKRAVRIRQYLGIEQYSQYEEFLIAWNRLIRGLQEYALTVLKQETGHVHMEDVVKVPALNRLNSLVIRTFFDMPYNTELDFYPQFQKRLLEIQNQLT